MRLFVQVNGQEQKHLRFDINLYENSLRNIISMHLTSSIKFPKRDL